MCVPCVQRPDRGHRERDWTADAGVRRAVEAELTARGWALVATDGAAQGANFRERVAAWGVCGWDVPYGWAGGGT